MEYYVPRTKDGLIRFFVLRCGYHVSGLRTKPKNQLLAIYHKVMSSRSYDNFTLTT